MGALIRFVAPVAWSTMVLAVMALSACRSQHTPPAPEPYSLVEACTAFQSRASSSGVTITSIDTEDAIPGRPATCVVRARITSSPTSIIHFKLELPSARTWNRKTLTIGGSGFDGFIVTDTPGWSTVLLGGFPSSGDDYAVVSSDSGHQGRPPMAQLDFSWALDNPVALTNHAYLANHLVLNAAVDLVTQFYGEPPVRRYMLGASNGGRSGLAAAQRFPDDYHGIVAIAPAISQLAFAVNVGSRLMAPNFASEDRWLSPSKIALFEQAQLAACDALDGLADGVIGNPDACDFDPARLQCAAADEVDCLTASQVESVRRIRSPMKAPVPLADGLVGYPAYGPGAESIDWPIFMFGTGFEAQDAINLLLAREIIRYAITGDPRASVLTHDPVPYARRYLEVSQLIDATNPDLSAFEQAGGKLLIWHGVADGCVSYRRTAQYFESMRDHMGQERVSTFVRYYTLPGVSHGLMGPGAGSVHFLGALESWVERGAAPDDMLAHKRSETAPEEIVFSRPLCQYPAFARYTGLGDPAHADSFVCDVDE